MWTLRIIDRYSDTLCIELKFNEIDELVTFLLMNEEHSTERCKYVMMRDGEVLPFDEIEDWD